MSPYFYNLEKPLISAGTRALLIEIGLEYGKAIKGNFETPLAVPDARGVTIVQLPNRTTALGASALQKISEIQEIKCLESSFSHPPTRNLLLYTLPVEGVSDKASRHIDGRPCSIVIPLWPVGDDYAKTTYWKDYETDTPLASRGYEDGMPFLMNTHKLHSVAHYNYKCLRFNFQFSMAEDFQTVMTSMVAGTFFKPNPKEML